MTTTDNMQLVLATVSETLGPEWAQMLNTIFGRLDLHDHSEGNGAKVTPAGMEINATLDLKANILARALLIALEGKASADTAQTGSLQRIGSNLWWINAAGVAVQITSGTSVVSTGSGALRVSVPGAYPYTVVTGDDMKVIAVDTSSARTVTLPAASNAMAVWIKDAAGSASTNNITVEPDGTDLIDGANDDYLIDGAYQAVAFVSDGVSKWYAV